MAYQFHFHYCFFCVHGFYFEMFYFFDLNHRFVIQIFFGNQNCCIFCCISFRAGFYFCAHAFFIAYYLTFQNVHCFIHRSCHVGILHFGTYNSFIHRYGDFNSGNQFFQTQCNGCFCVRGEQLCNTIHFVFNHFLCFVPYIDVLTNNVVTHKNNSLRDPLFLRRIDEIYQNRHGRSDSDVRATSFLSAYSYNSPYFFKSLFLLQKIFRF